MIFVKTLLLITLIIPATLLTVVVWLLGGWTKGWDYMPNPAYALIEWLRF